MKKEERYGDLSEWELDSGLDNKMQKVTNSPHPLYVMTEFLLNMATTYLQFITEYQQENGKT